MSECRCCCCYAVVALRDGCTFLCSFACVARLPEKEIGHTELRHFEHQCAIPPGKGSKAPEILWTGFVKRNKPVETATTS